MLVGYEFNIPLCIAFVDYQKAFDSVKIPFIMSALKHQGMDIAYINIYNKGTSFICLHINSEPFSLQRGVRQGDTISPKLFTACLESLLRTLNWDNKGFNTDGEYLNHLRFADDIILLSEEPKNYKTHSQN